MNHGIWDCLCSLKAAKCGSVAAVRCSTVRWNRVHVAALLAAGWPKHSAAGLATWYAEAVMTDVCPSSKQTFLMLPPEKTRGSRSDHPRSQLYHCSQLTGDKFRPEASVVSPLVTFAAARLYCRDSAGEKFTGRRLIPPDGKKWRSEARTNVGTRIFAAESLHQGENFRLLGPCVTGRK